MADIAAPQPPYHHIVRIVNVDIPGDKQIAHALTKIKGIGKNFAHAICMVAGISQQLKTGNMSDQQIELLNKVVSQPQSHGIPKWMFNRKKDYESGEDRHILTGDLQFTIDNDLKRLKKIKTYRGLRHQKGQPVRGQRTRSNFRKNKGKVVGVKKQKQEPQKEGGKKDSGKKEGGKK